MIEFLKKHWYIITMGILTLVMIILVIIDQILWQAPSDPSTQTNCQPAPDNRPITSLRINSSQDECDGGNCCSGDFTRLPIQNVSSDGQNYWYINQASQSKPYNQICTQSTDTYCDQTTVITDVFVQDMTDETTGAYKTYSNRCCDGSDDSTCYITPIASVNLPNASSGESGLLINDDQNVKKMGICVKKQTMGDLRKNNGSYIGMNDLKLVYSDNPNASPQGMCGSGWTPSGENIFKGLGKQMYLCKKFTNVS